MKLSKLYQLIWVLPGLLMTGSCGKDFLDTRLDTMPTDENIKSSYTTIKQLANTPYAYMRNINEFTALDGNLFAPVSDEAVQTNTVGDVYLFNNGVWSPFNNPDDRYSYYYAGINAVNYFLEYLDKHDGDYRSLLAVNRDTITVDTRKAFLDDVALMGWSIAEAHVIRAYYYFELIKRYGKAPLVNKTFPANTSPQIAASSFDEVTAYIVKEINDYQNALQPNWKTSAFANQDGRFSRGAALALKARVLQYAASPLHNASNDQAKWIAAANAANEALEFARQTGNNQLDNNYRNYFLGSNTLTSAETIMAVRFDPDNALERANYPIGTAGGNSGITPTQNLVGAYEWKGAADPNNPYANRDPRLEMSIVTNGSNWNGRIIDQSAGQSDDARRQNASRTGYYLKKFVNDQVDLINNATNTHHWPVFRYAELLLTYAEAMNEAYGPDQSNGQIWTAREAVNLVRSRPSVKMPAVVAAGKEQLRSAIKRERQVELAFENYRYWDVVRWGDAATVQNQTITGVSVSKTAAGVFQYQTKEVQQRKFIAPKMNYYPFPQREIQISNGTLTQNPGW